MTNGADVGSDLRGLLEAVEAAPPVRAVEVLASVLADMVRAKDVTFLIADFSGDSLIRFTDIAQGTLPGAVDGEGLTTVPLANTYYDEAIRTQQVVLRESPGETRLFAPVTDRGDALGVLELSLPARPDEATVAFIASAAHALAYVIIANRRHTDLFERGQRNMPFSLAAEIQRRLLPDAFTCEAAEFTVAGWLEPASDIGGDTFDYSVERDILYLTISDAKGHTVQAAQLATLAVASLRNSRRASQEVVIQAESANRDVLENSSEDDFVSALLVRVDLSTGRAHAVNAGHPLPYLVRNNRVESIPLDPDLPFGMLGDFGYQDQTFDLQPGDRLVMVTDGMLERNATSLDIAGALLEMKDLHPREVVHNFARAIVHATEGHPQDDATVMCIDWYGPQDGNGDRVAWAGATQSRASSTTIIKLD